MQCCRTPADLASCSAIPSYNEGGIRITDASLPLAESSMFNVVMLADLEAEHMNGGRRGPSFNFSSGAIKTVTTNFGQSNSSNNLGLGALLGAGNATSEQINLASVSTWMA